jgi:ABC-type multidrug transport system permease subunit
MARASDQLVALGAMLGKNVRVAFRYPVNVASRILRLLVMLPLFFLGIAMFWDGGLPGLVASEHGQQLVGVSIYGFVIYQFTADSLWMIGHYIRQEQIEGTFESLHLSPANRTVYLLARFIEPIVLSGINSLVAVTVVSVAFVPPPMTNLGPALVALSCTLAGVFGLGCAFAALTLLIHESAQAMAGVVQFALLVLCSMLVPFHSLPPLLRTVSQCIPLSYCVDLFRSAMMGYPAGYPELAPVTTELVIVALWGAGMPLLGLWLYHRAERYARIHGLLGRF